ncbi:MAG: hypothetical protein V3V01_09690, partial [Acidimicrobiales bacterium]
MPLSTITQLDALEVPVTITPELPGRWQWIGTKTLRFEHDPDIFDRLPAATEFTVEIPAGTTAATGSRLAQAFSWSFATPPVGVVEIVPANGATLGLEPLFFVRFDQTIDPAAVLETISLTANDDEFALRLATSDEVESDRRVSKQASKTSDDRWLAFRAQGPLPRDAQLRVAVGPGVASAEGPRLNESTHTWLRNGIRSTEHFSIEGDSTVLEIPIDESHVPNLSIQVDLAGTTERTTAGGEPLPDAPRRPAFAVGSLDLSVPPLTRTLTVTAEPRNSSLEPGAATTINVLVVDDDGQAVSGSEVALVVVDEAVLGLTGYQLPDPLELFYDPIWNRIESSYGRSSIVLADLRLLLTED